MSLLSENEEIFLLPGLVLEENPLWVRVGEALLVLWGEAGEGTGVRSWFQSGWVFCIEV